VLTAPDRIERVNELLASMGGIGPALDRLSALAAGLVGGSSAQVSILSDLQHVVGAAGSARSGARSDIEDSLCSVTAAHGSALVVPDARAHAWVSGLTPVVSGAVGSYLGVPLRARQGDVLGALCVFDREPRSFGDDAVALLEQLAEWVMTEIELRSTIEQLASTSSRLERIATAAGLGGWEWRVGSDVVVWDAQMYELFDIDPVSWGHRLDDVFACMHPADRATTRHVLEQAVAESGGYDAEYRVALRDGTFRWVRAWGQALTGRDGRTDRVVGVACDTTRLRTERERVARSFEHMTDAVYSIDHDDRFTYLNPWTEFLLERRAEDLVGRSLYEVVPPQFHALYRARIEEARRTAQTVAFERFDDERDRWWEIRFLPSPEGISVHVRDITQRKGIERERAELLAHHQTVANALQAAVLPDRLPEVPGIALAARYRPADVGVKVGGDWYDAFVLDGRRLVLAVGDVAGHGLPAASVMGQLRNALRAFALLGKDPGRVLLRLNQLLGQLEPTAMATVWLGELDLVSGRLTWASAGHPPVLLRRGASVDFLEGTANPPLGAVPAFAGFVDHTTDLLPGDIVFAYSDGLVERRGETIRDGLARLAEVAGAGPAGTVEDYLASIIGHLIGDRSVDDDVCALAIANTGLVAAK